MKRPTPWLNRELPELAKRVLRSETDATLKIKFKLIKQFISMFMLVAFNGIQNAAIFPYYLVEFFNAEVTEELALRKSRENS